MGTVTASPTTVSSLGLPFGRPLTAVDLESLPDDGHRYELLDGTLLVSPAPSWQHQGVSGELYLALRRACPTDLRVFFAPLAVRLSPETEFQPDLLVTRHSDLGARHLPVAPLLAVEIRSPSTALIDRTLKRAAYARFGVRRTGWSIRTRRHPRSSLWSSAARTTEKRRTPRAPHSSP